MEGEPDEIEERWKRQEEEAETSKGIS